MRSPFVPPMCHFLLVLLQCRQERSRVVEAFVSRVDDECTRPAGFASRRSRRRIAASKRSAFDPPTARKTHPARAGLSIVCAGTPAHTDGSSHMHTHTNGAHAQARASTVRIQSSSHRRPHIRSCACVRTEVFPACVPVTLTWRTTAQKMMRRLTSAHSRARTYARARAREPEAPNLEQL
jgi:hypothetical protein